MTEQTNNLSFLTNTAIGQSDNNALLSTKCSDSNSVLSDEMISIIRAKDQQIADLQATILQQSEKILQQTTAIENLQKQMTELSENLATLVNRSTKTPTTPKVAPIFISASQSTSSSNSKKNKKAKTSSVTKMKNVCIWPSLAEPKGKKRRHNADEYNTDDWSSGNTSKMELNESGVSDLTNPQIDVTNVSIDKFTETNKNNDNANNDNDSEINLHNKEQVIDLEKDWTSACMDDGSNYVNFKKNSIKKEKSVTPIELSIRNAEKGALHALLLQHFNNNSFLWSNASKKTIRINPFTQKTKNDMIAWLKSRKYQFHTFLNKEDKTNAFIIRGLPNSINRSHIANALQQAGIPFNALDRHSTGFTRFHQRPSDLWRITTPNSITIQHFKAIDGILNVKIRVEVLKKAAVLQCKNCQLFFHSAAGCHRKFRCVKCDQDHPPQKCPRNDNRSLPVVCCNCHKNHSANDLQHCDFFAKHIKPVIEKRTKDRAKSATIQTNDEFDHFTANRIQNNLLPSPTTESYSSVVSKNANSNLKATAPKKVAPNSNSSNQPQLKAIKISNADLKALLLQNMHLMTAQQELLQKLSCLVE